MQSIAAVSHPSSLNVAQRHRAPDHTVTEQDTDCDFPDPGLIVALSHAVVAALSWPERHGISLESQDYYEQLEIVFFPL